MRDATFLAGEAYDFLAARFLAGRRTVLDIGAGAGAHAAAFRALGLQVTTVNLTPMPGFEADYLGDYAAIEFGRRFDVIWCSHVLEHQRNPGLFLEKVYRDLDDSGVLALTVPPLKHEVVGGHVSLWNAGVLLYQLVLAGFDCSQAAVKQYDYNVSVITPKRRAVLPELRMDEGDIERLAPYFPIPAFQGFDGRISSVNWD